MFPSGGPNVTYVYDFGTEWTHEITRQKTITLDAGQAYPVCVAFGGDSPVEYPSEEEPQEPESFNQAAVNTALAGILRSLFSCPWRGPLKRRGEPPTIQSGPR